MCGHRHGLRKIRYAITHYFPSSSLAYSQILPVSPVLPRARTFETGPFDVLFKSLFKSKQYLYSVLRAITYMHEHNILYRDIKPSNVLWDDDSATAKVIDFDISTFYSGDNRLHKRYVGTDGYMAPEQLAIRESIKKKTPCAYRGYGLPLDVYAAGVIFAQLAYQVPENDVTDDDRLNDKGPSFRKRAQQDLRELAIDEAVAMAFPSASGSSPKPGADGEPFEYDMATAFSMLTQAFPYKRAITAPTPTSPPSPRSPPLAASSSASASGMPSSAGLVRDPFALDLLIQLLEPNPDARITTAEALAHPFFAGFELDNDTGLVSQSSPATKV